MKLSTKSRYGARILMELARRKGDGPVQVSEIFDKQKIPVKYLEQIIRMLREAGFINSFRGAKGGHIIAKDPGKITLGEIVRLLEGQKDLVECISLPESCDMSDECRIRLAWKEAADALFKKLDNITIKKILNNKSYTP
ncbi:MAG: Rrf2 family transcriptional regulator [Deltaproteobacteria bacterium]|nr:Rrf2 family transcriptional regulator [Deltaproteobacteria bacterium]